MDIIVEVEKKVLVNIDGGRGPKGDDGADGATGPKGDKGDTGETGPPGADGDPATNLVTSVAGRQGAVVLTKADVALGNVDNTSDANKPISNDTQTALNLKVDKSNNLSDLTNAATARINLGIGSLELSKTSITTTASTIDFNNYKIPGNTLIVGDSTIGAYAGQPAISTIIKSTGTITDISAPGHTINQQLAAYNALSTSVKTLINYAFVQIGLNDLNPAESAVLAINRLQTLINTIVANSPSAKIIISCMLPCKQRLINVYGAVNGITSYEKWVVINFFISNGILNTNSYADLHVGVLSDGNDNLSSTFDTGDGIHENTLGRQVIAYSWITKLYEEIDLQPANRTGNTITFDSNVIYNQSAPITGNILSDLTVARKGIVQKIYHNDSVSPTFPTGWVRLGSNTYTTNVLNIIYAEWVSGTRVEYWIVKEG